MYYKIIGSGTPLPHRVDNVLPGGSGRCGLRSQRWRCPVGSLWTRWLLRSLSPPWEWCPGVRRSSPRLPWTRGRRAPLAQLEEPPSSLKTRCRRRGSRSKSSAVPSEPSTASGSRKSVGESSLRSRRGRLGLRSTPRAGRPCVCVCPSVQVPRPPTGEDRTHSSSLNDSPGGCSAI